MTKRFVNDEVKPSGPFDRVLFISTIIVLLCVGFYIYLTMVIEIEEHGDEIKAIGPPGITNIVPMVIMVFVSIIGISIVLKVTGNKKKS